MSGEIGDWMEKRRQKRGGNGSREGRKRRGEDIEPGGRRSVKVNTSMAETSVL